MDFNEFWTNSAYRNEVLAIAGVVLAVLGIPIGVGVSYYFYRKSLVVQEPCWNITNNNLVTHHMSHIDGLAIQYNGTPVDTLAVARIVLWNNGNRAINASDLVNSNLPHIRTSKTDGILNISIIDCNDQHAQFQTDFTLRTSLVTIQFDHLKPGRGALLEVVHIGDSVNDLSVGFDLKDGKPLKQGDFIIPQDRSPQLPQCIRNSSAIERIRGH